MNNWANVSYWVFMTAMLRLSYEVEASQNGSGEEPGDYAPMAGGSNPPGDPSHETAERVKRFAALPPTTQERILAYGEKMVEYLQD